MQYRVNLTTLQDEAILAPAADSSDILASATIETGQSLNPQCPLPSEQGIQKMGGCLLKTCHPARCVENADVLW